MQRIIAIRGATTISANTKDEITKGTLELLSKLITENNIIGSESVSIISLILGSTVDIDEFYPATAVTQSGLLKNVPLFSTLEPSIKNSLPLCIRLLLTVHTSSDFIPKHVYLHGAKKLCTNTN